MSTKTAFPTLESELLASVTMPDPLFATAVEDELALLRQQAMLFRATFEHAAVGIAHLAPDGHWLRVNQRLCAILGYTEHELIRLTFQELTYPDDLPADLSLVMRALAGELQTYTIRKRYLHKAGHLVWANLTVSLIRQPDGRPDYFISLVEDVTPLVQAEAALRQSEARYRQVVEAQTDIVWRYRPDFTLTFVNGNGALAVGQSAATLSGQSILQWLPPAYHQVLRTAHAALTPEHATASLTLPLLGATNEWHWFHWTCCLVADAEGSPYEYQGVGRDITHQRELELQLRYNASLQEQVSDAVIVTDLALCVRSWNQAATQIYGWDASEATGQPLERILSIQPQTPLEYEFWQTLLQTGQWQGELQQRRKDGCWLAIQSSMTLLRDEHELPIGVIVINRDISERKRADEAIREQRDFLQLVIDSVPDLITVNDRAGRFQMVNERAAQIYGLTAAEMVGKSDLEVNPNHEEVAYFLQTDQAAFNRVQPLFIPEQTIQGRYYQTTKIPLPTSNGLPPDRLLVVSSDITKHKEAEVGLQQALVKERELGELKSRFVSIASHEFRTPLTTILGLATMLRDYWPQLTQEKIRERLTKICEQVGYLEGIIDDVLQLARFQGGHIPFHPAPLNLATLCQTVVDEFQSRPLRHQLRFRQESPIDEAALDSKLMRQMLNNLIANAIKYSAADKVVQVTLAQRANLLVLQVRDEGIGIPAADLTYLFEPFHRAANVGKIAGTGLGLTITKAAVALHGGQIEVDSQVGRGTTFTVSLPVT